VQTARNTIVPAIQQALQNAHIDGWLFYSFRDSDPIAASILGVVVKATLPPVAGSTLFQHTAIPSKSFIPLNEMSSIICRASS